MATYIKVGNDENLYPAVIGGKMNDKEWDGRPSKYIHAEMTYNEAVSKFYDDVAWSIVQDVEHEVEHIDEETGESVMEVITEQDVYDNSEYSILGDITVHKDGTVTISMGMPTAEEILAMFEEVL